MNDVRRQLTLDRIRACIAAADHVATPEQLLAAERALADTPAPRQPSLFEAPRLLVIANRGNAEIAGRGERLLSDFARPK